MPDLTYDFVEQEHETVERLLTQLEVVLQQLSENRPHLSQANITSALQWILHEDEKDCSEDEYTDDALNRIKALLSFTNAVLVFDKGGITAAELETDPDGFSAGLVRELSMAFLSRDTPPGVVCGLLNQSYVEDLEPDYEANLYYVMSGILPRMGMKSEQYDRGSGE